MTTSQHDLIDEMLRNAHNIAVVGMSDKPHRASFNIGRYLAENGYRIFPVNPALQEVLGRVSHPDLDAAQAAARGLVLVEDGAGRSVERVGEDLRALVARGLRQMLEADRQCEELTKAVPAEVVLLQ